MESQLLVLWGKPKTLYPSGLTKDPFYSGTGCRFRQILEDSFNWPLTITRPPEVISKPVDSPSFDPSVPDSSLTAEKAASSPLILL